MRLQDAGKVICAIFEHLGRPPEWFGSELPQVERIEMDVTKHPTALEPVATWEPFAYERVTVRWVQTISGRRGPVERFWGFDELPREAGRRVSYRPRPDVLLVTADGWL